jgi:hypothetical protein
MSSDEQERIVELLRAMSPSLLERLRSRGAEVIASEIGGGEEKARLVLHELEERGIVRAQITRGGPLDDRRPAPLAMYFFERGEA